LGETGEPAAIEIFSSAGQILGREIANLINIFNPQLLLVSGEGTRIGDLIFDSMRLAINTHVMSTLRDDTEIRVDHWGDDAWAIGAASLVLQDLFASPIHQRKGPR